MERWREFPLFLPPLEEQHEIVSYLEEEIARVNSLLALVAEQAALLSERRSAFRTSLVEGRQGARGVLV
jgi:restriction endonuclease S subunit